MKTIPCPYVNPSQPTYVLPADACDAHCHIFGPAAEFPFSPTRTYTPPDVGKDKLFALHKHLGISNAVLVQASCHGLDNRAMISAMNWSKGRWRGVAMVDENVTDDELQQLHAAGVRGTRFNFVAHLGGAPDVAAVKKIVERVSPLGWHVDLHLDAQDIPGYRCFLDALQLPFVIDHMGRVESRHGLNQEPFRQLRDLVKTNEFAWVKISGADRVSSKGKPYVDAIPFGRQLVEAAPSRILWGTDYPHPNVNQMPDDGELVDLFAAMIDDEGMRQKILVENPKALYWG